MIGSILSFLVVFASAPSFALPTPVLLTRYMAKEYCSCRFVVKQSSRTCINENKTTNLLFSIKEDLTNKRIMVTSEFETAEARFLDDRFGCELTLK